MSACFISVLFSILLNTIKCQNATISISSVTAPTKYFALSDAAVPGSFCIVKSPTQSMALSNLPTYFYMIVATNTPTYIYSTTLNVNGAVGAQDDDVNLGDVHFPVPFVTSPDGTNITSIDAVTRSSDGFLSIVYGRYDITKQEDDSYLFIPDGQGEQNTNRDVITLRVVEPTNLEFLSQERGLLMLYIANPLISSTQYCIGFYDPDTGWINDVSDARLICKEAPFIIYDLQLMTLQPNSNYYIINYNAANSNIGSDVLLLNDLLTDVDSGNIIIQNRDIVYDNLATNKRFHDSLPVLNHLTNVHQFYLMITSHVVDTQTQIIFDLRYVYINSLDETDFESIGINPIDNEGTNLPFLYDLSNKNPIMHDNIIKIVDITLIDDVNQYDYELDTNCDAFGLVYADIPDDPIDEELEYKIKIRLFEICIININNLIFEFNWITDDYIVNINGGLYNTQELSVASNAIGNLIMIGWIEYENSGETQNVYARILDINIDSIDNEYSINIVATTNRTINTGPAFSGKPIKSDIKSPKHSATAYFYIGASNNEYLLGTTIDIDGNTNYAAPTDFNDPGLWATALPVEGSIIDTEISHLRMYINDNDEVIYLFTVAETNYTHAFQYFVDKSISTTTAIANGYGAQLLQTYSGDYIIFYVQPDILRYQISTCSSPLSGVDTTCVLRTTSPASNVAKPNVIKLLDTYFIIFCSVANGKIQNDVYYYGSSVGFYEDADPLALLSSSFKNFLSQDIKQIFVNIPFTSLDSSLSATLSNRTFMVAYTQMWESGTSKRSQIVLDVLCLHDKAAPLTYQISPYAVNTSNTPITINIGGLVNGNYQYFENSVKFVDIEFTWYEISMQCDVMALVYFTDQNEIYLYPFEICIDISDPVNIVTSSTFNWLIDQPYLVNDLFTTVYSLSVASNSNAGDTYVMITWLQDNKSNVRRLYARSFKFDLVNNIFTIQPTEVPTAIPTPLPTTNPTENPSEQPTTQQPTQQPTQPTRTPSNEPSSQPTNQPSKQPTVYTSPEPTITPTTNAPTTAITSESQNTEHTTKTATNEPTTNTPTEGSQGTSLSTMETIIESQNTQSDTGNTDLLEVESSVIDKFELDILLKVIIGIVAVLIFITFLALIHKTKGNLFPCFWPSDDATIGSLFVYSLQLWDFFSDSVYSYELAQDYGIDNKINLLFQLSLIFLILPWLFNVIFLFYQRRKWIVHATVNAWIRDYAWLLMGLTMISGGANAVIQLCNSNLFGLKLFQMNLPRHEMIRMSKYPILLSSILENIPQIAIQYSYLTSDYALNQSNNSSSTSSAALFALLSSSLALLFSFGVLILRCTDPLDDLPFCIVCKLNQNENIKSIQKNLGYRLKIARYVAQSLEVGKELVKVDKITVGNEKLLIYLSITSPIKNNKNKSARMKALSKRSSVAIRKMKSMQAQDEEVNVDEWLNKLLNAQNNGSLAKNLKKCISLEYVPIIDNIYHDDANSLLKHIELQNNEIIMKSDTNTFKMNGEDEYMNKGKNTIQINISNNDKKNNNHSLVIKDSSQRQKSKIFDDENDEEIVDVNQNNDQQVLPKPVPAIVNVSVTAGGYNGNYTSSDSDDDDVVNINGFTAGNVAANGEKLYTK